MRTRFFSMILRLGICAVGLALTACDNMIATSDFIPWYASLVQRSVPAGDLLPVEYRYRSIQLLALDGPSAADPAAARARWFVFYQDRSPEPSLAAILDENLAVRFTVTNTRIYNNPRRWFIDSTGAIELGGVTVKPPSAADQSWSSADSPPTYQGYGDRPWTAIAGTNYAITLTVDMAGTRGPAGALHIGDWRFGPAQIMATDAAWNVTPRVPTLIYPNFHAQYGTMAVGTMVSGDYNLECQSVITDASNVHIMVRCMDASSMVISLPLKALESINPGGGDTVRVTVLSMGQQSSNYQSDSSMLLVVPGPDGTWLSRRPKTYDSSSSREYMPLAWHGADGTLKKMVRSPLTNLRTSTGGSLNSFDTSVGQQAWLIPGARTWLAVDGFTGTFQICRPWWE